MASDIVVRTMIDQGQLTYYDSTEISCLAGIRAFLRVAKKDMLMEDAVVKQKLAVSGECVIPLKTGRKEVLRKANLIR